MITYTTKFPVDKKFDKCEFVKTVIEWNKGSLYDRINNIDWNENIYDCEWTQDNVSLSLQEIEKEQIVASRLRKEDEHGIWCTDFVLNNETNMLSVSVSLETTEFTTDFFPKYYPPYFVKMVIFKGFAGVDNGITVLNKEHEISECMSFFRKVADKTVIPELPVVYVTRTVSGDNPIDVNKLAFRLQGVAHVICEPEDKSGLKDLSEITDISDDMGGKIFIYYTSNNKKRRIFNQNGTIDESDYMEDKIVSDIYDYMNSKMRKPIDTWEGVTIEKLHIENKKLLSDRNEKEEENNSLYDIFGEQLEKMEESNIKLSNKVQYLTAELQGLRMKYYDNDRKPVLYSGHEKEFYTDEIKEIILDIISEYQKNCVKDSRRWHIISDLLECNDFKGLPLKRKEELKKTLKGYKTFNSSIKGVLETLGFEISEDGKHYKLTYYGDHRYRTTASKTSSDARTGINLSSIIGKMMF